MHYRLRKLIREIHRRSVWQVLGVYLAMSWGVLNAVDVLTGFAGLPDWTPTMALVLLMIGLPIVTATAFIQKGVSGLTADPHEEIHPDDVEGVSPAEVLVVPEAHSMYRSGVFTWRNAILGGVMAGTLLIATVVMYVVMWSMGVGPVGSLVAQGVLEERDPILLAQFENRTDDASLGAVVAEALAVDLGESQMVTLLSRGSLRTTLTMMGRDPNEIVTSALAQEIAIRDNVKAIIEGEVSKVGSRYLLAARIVRPEDGSTISSYRENATGDDDLLPAIDRLSSRLREKMGESLKTIRLGAPLEQVTTSSLQALRDYTAAERAEEQGDYAGAQRLLANAVALDTAFAMAYRKLSVLLFNQGSSQDEIAEASELAYRFRDRLTPLERHLAEANYHNTVTMDKDAAIRAYEAALAIDPDDGTSLNNLSNLLNYRARSSEALELLERAVAGPGMSSVAAFNLSATRLITGDSVRATEAFQAYETSFPGHVFVPWARLMFAAWAGDVPGTHLAAQAALDDGRVAFVSENASRSLMAIDLSVGRLSEGLAHVTDGMRSIGHNIALGQGITEAPLGVPDVLLWMLDDSASVGPAVRDLMNRVSFDDDPPAIRRWAPPVIALADAGDVEAARSLYDRWQAEVVDTALISADRDIALARILAAEGDPSAALVAIERAATTMRCDRCVERYSAQIYEDLGRNQEAIDIWVRIRDFPLELQLAPWSRIVAKKRLGPLYEQVGDSANAIAAYQAFTAAWADADPELQPQVQRARARIAALGGQ